MSLLKMLELITPAQVERGLQALERIATGLEERNRIDTAAARRRQRH